MKNMPLLVIPFNIKLLQKTKNKQVVLRINDISELEKILDINESTRIRKINEIIFETDLSISELNFKKHHSGLSISIYSSKAGNYLALRKKTDILKSLNVKVFLSSAQKENYKDVRLLSSLGIKTGIYFDKKVYWDELIDTLSYYVYTQTNHNIIEPFHYIINNFDKTKCIDFNQIYMNKPLDFIYVNSNEDVALCKEDIDNSAFIFNGIGNITKTKINQYKKLNNEELQRVFIQREICAYCHAWKICLGKFKDECQISTKPKEFFIEVFDAIKYQQNSQNRKK